MTKKRESKEKMFQNSFIRVSGQMGHHCAEIPDVLGSIAERERQRQGEQYRKPYLAKPRPCDAVFSSRDGNLFIEFKYGNNHLTSRQRLFGEKIEKMNGLFMVVRKKESIKKGKIEVIYRIEDTQRYVYYGGDDIGDIIKEVSSFVRVRALINYKRGLSNG